MPRGAAVDARSRIARSGPTGIGDCVYVSGVSAAILVEAVSVSPYRLVRDGVRSQPIHDRLPVTVSARGSRLPSGCGSTTCVAVTVTLGEFGSQVYDDPSASSVTVHTAVGSLGCCNQVREPTASGPASRHSTA